MTVRILLCLSLLPAGSGLARDRGIVNNGRSPHVRLRSIDIGDCRWTTGFWADRFRQCAEVTVPRMGELLQGDRGHALTNFKIAAGLAQGEFKGTWWLDGDFYKWMEAATYVYAVTHEEHLVRELDAIIAVIAQAQRPDGYLSTPIQIRGVAPFTARKYHELYNMGHLLTAACIHHRVTGRRNFLDVAIKTADHLVRVFGSRPARLARFGFNPTQIMGLVELYRTTGDRRYLDLAGTFVDMRGTHRPPRGQIDPVVRPNMDGDMAQDRIPLRQEDEAVGHAVLAMYLYAGAADVVAETGDRDLAAALDRIWTDVVERKLYVTGAVGQGHHGISRRRDPVHEAFLAAYEAPNASAYNETCANVAHAMFNWRMLGLTGRSRHADVMERVLYNSALSGISLDGTSFFYTNPLRRTRDHVMDTTDYATRVDYIPCFCCPPNLVRTIAKLSGWAYGLTDDGLAVILYGSNRLTTHLRDGTALALEQTTRYPWEGSVTLTVKACQASPFEIRLRIPAWAGGASLRVNGRDPGVTIEPGTFACVARTWRPGDVLTLDLPLESRLLVGDPRIEALRNQAAVQRGPVVYCLESPDLPAGTSILDAYLPSDVRWQPVARPDVLGGVTTLAGTLRLQSGGGTGMYRPLRPPTWKSVTTQLIPYFAWSNRGVSEMSVWLPLIWE